MEFVEDVRNTPYLADFMQDAEDVIPDASYILSEDGELPWTVAKWANLHPSETDALIAMNDMQRFSFNTIADYIEENL